MKMQIKNRERFILIIFLAVALSQLLCGGTVHASEVTSADTSSTEETKNGLVKEDDGYIYYYENSVRQTGWKTIGSKTYYFYASAHGSIPQGSAATGLVKIGDFRYYFSDSGKMQTGWKTIDGSKYYFKKKASSTTPKGAALTGVWKIGDNKYYFSSTGKMKTGLRTYNGKKYYFASDGTMIKSTWKTVNGAKYYFKSNGVAATGGYKINGIIYVFKASGKLAEHSSSKKIVGVSGTYYCVDSSGKALTSGWIIVDSKLCYATANGELKKDTTYEGITFNSKGYATDDTAAKLKMKTMSIVESITTSDMTQSQKLKKCWNYIVSSSNFKYRTIGLSSFPSGWQITTAYNMLVSHSGSCYSFACAFAALANEVGYDSYVIVGRVSGTRDGAADGLTRHCWVKINGCYYDPEACFAGWWTSCYGLSSYSITHQVIATYRFAAS
ncbi:MAG: hypothetical protein LUD12_12090 [Lachnospiraceae bacterium]|nr:hypothetical protein [Lachnospiraceae bacterium]